MIKIFKIRYSLDYLTKIIRMRNGVICTMWMWLMLIDVAKMVQEVQMSDCLSMYVFDEYVCSWLIINDITSTQIPTAYYTNPRLSGVLYDHYKLISAAIEGRVAGGMAPDGFLIMHIDGLWASYQIRKIAGCACAGNTGNVFPHRRLQRKPLGSDPDMHHGTCVTHMPWCMSGSLTRGAGKTVKAFPEHAHPQFFVSGKRPMVIPLRTW